MWTNNTLKSSRCMCMCVLERLSWSVCVKILLQNLEISGYKTKLISLFFHPSHSPVHHQYRFKFVHKYKINGSHYLSSSYEGSHLRHHNVISVNHCLHCRNGELCSSDSEATETTAVLNSFNPEFDSTWTPLGPESS